MNRYKRMILSAAALALFVPVLVLAGPGDGDRKWGRNDDPGRIDPRQVVPVPDGPGSLRVVPVPDDGDPLTIETWLRGGDRTYYPGDRVTVFFRTSRDAFVLLYDVDTEGRVHQIYPRTEWDDEYVQGGVTYAVPGSGAGYRLMVTGPSGREDIVALAGDRPLSDRWDTCWGGITSSNDYDDLGGVRLRMGRLGANRLAGMDELTQKLVEVPTGDRTSDTAFDQLTFRVGRRHADDWNNRWDGRRGRRSRW